METEHDKDPGYEGLRILARMIARVYLEEVAAERRKEREKKEQEESARRINPRTEMEIRERTPHINPVDSTGIYQGSAGAGQEIENKYQKGGKCHANQRSKRSCKASPAGENQAGNQERDRR